jgi:hypothetical protein
MLDAAALITKHQGRGVFIDTNLLVLLLVGLVNPSRIPSFKRTQDFSTDDFRVLHPLFERFGLGDASVAQVCARGIVVLTADVQLQIALGSMGLDAINFNHVRPLARLAASHSKLNASFFEFASRAR